MKAQGDRIPGKQQQWLIQLQLIEFLQITRFVKKKPSSFIKQVRQIKIVLTQPVVLGINANIDIFKAVAVSHLQEKMKEEVVLLALLGNNADPVVLFQIQKQRQGSDIGKSLLNLFQNCSNIFVFFLHQNGMILMDRPEKHGKIIFIILIGIERFLIHLLKGKEAFLLAFQIGVDISLNCLFILFQAL